MRGREPLSCLFYVMFAESYGIHNNISCTTYANCDRNKLLTKLLDR